MRSPDHAALYAAELAAFDGTDLESICPLDDLLGLIRRVVAGPWWPGPPVEARAARADARSSTTRHRRADGHPVTLHIAAPQATIATATHELAHALAGRGAAHGPVFRAAYLDVVAVVTNLAFIGRRGSLHVDQLRQAFDDHGLAVGERRWPTPPDVSSIAL